MLVKNILFIPKGMAYQWRGILQCPFASSIICWGTQKMLRCISLDETHCHIWSLSGCFCISCDKAVPQFYIDTKCNMKLQHNFLFSVFINVFILYVFSHEVEVDNFYTYTHTYIHAHIRLFWLWLFFPRQGYIKWDCSDIDGYLYSPVLGRTDLAVVRTSTFPLISLCFLPTHSWGL